MICKPGTLSTHLQIQPDIQEFALLFHTFDETKSWYMEENLRRHCAPPCQANTQDSWYQLSNKFAGRKRNFLVSVITKVTKDDVIYLNILLFLFSFLFFCFCSNQWLRGRNTSWPVGGPAPASQVASVKCGQQWRVPCSALPRFTFHRSRQKRTPHGHLQPLSR